MTRHAWAAKVAFVAVDQKYTLVITRSRAFALAVAWMGRTIARLRRYEDERLYVVEEIRGMSTAEEGWGQWRPDIRPEDTKDPFESAILQAVGTASMCWGNVAAAGEFDTRKAQWVADGLIKYLRGLR